MVLSIGGIAAQSRYIRASMIETLREDYIRTALAKGLAHDSVFYKHALRNSIRPLITGIGGLLPGLIGGSIIIETIFAYPGLGRLGYEAVLERDYPTLVALNFIVAALVLLGNLISDVLYAVVGRASDSSKWSPIRTSRRRIQASRFAGPTRRVWMRFRRNTVGMIAAGSWLYSSWSPFLPGFAHGRACIFPHDPNATNLALKLKPPSLEHWLGTDNLGRDVFSRMLNGSYISLTVGFIAVAVSLLIGVTVGAISGYLGGWVDNVIMRIVDAILCFPTFFLILTAVALLGPNILNIIAVIGLVSWTGTARLGPAEFLTLRESEYVRAARTLGQRSLLIIFRHILPNAAAPIIVTAVLGIPKRF